MTYKINIPNFEGPLDLLLHLIKKEDMDIQNIDIEIITKQYLNYIGMMEELNLNIASEYLVMAAELLEIKSSSLIPNLKEETDDEFEENTKENLINRLLNYEQYKNITQEFKELENFRQNVFTREANDLTQYIEENTEINTEISINDLLEAFSKLMENKKMQQPLNTKITNKEYSVGKRCHEIKRILKNKKTIEFKELFDIFTKEYIVVTFLAILSMSRNQEIQLEQEYNFKNIIIKEKGD